MPEDDPALEPVRVEASAEAGLRVTWADGHVSRWDLPDVRAACRCAACNQLREAGEPVGPSPQTPERLDVHSAHLVGAYGVTFHWTDGHQTGVYTWPMLRAACGCPACGGRFPD